MNEVEAGEAVCEDGEGRVHQGGSCRGKSKASPDGSELGTGDGVRLLASSRGNPIFLVCGGAVEPCPDGDCPTPGVCEAGAIRVQGRLGRPLERCSGGVCEIGIGVCV